MSRGVRWKACEKTKQNKNRRGLEKVPMVVRQKACEKRGGAWRQCQVVSERKLVKKEAGQYHVVSDGKLVRNEVGLGNSIYLVPRVVRSKSCEK